MLHINLFGVTTVTSQGEPGHVTDFGGVKPRQILEILAVAGHAPVSKDRLVELLWGDAPPRSSVATLESYISVLRRRLGCAPGRKAALATTTNGYRLDPAAVQVDLVEFRVLCAAAAEASPLEALRLVEQALALVTGEFLASEQRSDWADRERTSFRAEVVDAATLGATRALEVADYGAAVRLAQQVIRCDQIDEVGWRCLMRALWQSGRRPEALRAYADLRTLLVTELGEEPSAQSSSLHLEILRDTGARPPSQHEQCQEIRTLTKLLHERLEALPVGSFPGVDRYLADLWPRALSGLDDLVSGLAPLPATSGGRSIAPASSCSAAMSGPSPRVSALRMRHHR